LGHYTVSQKTVTVVFVITSST